ncbi:hypothetical protein [Stenotrophomonas sp. PS02297]|uniref:hypothetical protein n=1 Tax=Stenotrophomonas sp. PS02297 TaxID=2991423 RepID=UPI00249A340E|nr:hypothetical protein [Stenotrophomonas sp. PS02297]
MAADVALRIACFVVFSDSCLGLRGAAPVGRSLFDYPQSLLIAATAFRGLAALVATFMAKRGSQV